MTTHLLLQALVRLQTLFQRDLNTALYKEAEIPQIDDEISNVIIELIANEVILHTDVHQ